MSTNKPPAAARALRRYVEQTPQAVVVGYASGTQEVNTTQAENTAVSWGQYAERIKDSEIFYSSLVPTKIKEGNILGRYKETTNTTNESSVVVHKNHIYVILGIQGCRADEFDGNIKFDGTGFIDTSGRVAVMNDVAQGVAIIYQCINKLDDLGGANGGRRIRLVHEDDLVGKYLKNSTSTSAKSTATNICGSGNETRIGNCCLYHSNPTKDAVTGITYAGGDFYDCVCTQCHKCVEIAKKLDMKYVFNAHEAIAGSLTGGTGPSCQCMADFPNDCGPCACRIQPKNVIDMILGDRNISPESSDYQNARIIKNNKLDSGVPIPEIDLTGIPEELRKLGVQYQKNGAKFADRNEIQLPIKASVPSGTETNITLRTYTSANGTIYFSGVQINTYGTGYTVIAMDTDKWTEICPGVPSDRIKFNITPYVGFASSIPQSSLLKPEVMISKEISISKMEQSGVVLGDLNRVSVTTLTDVDGGLVFSSESGDQEVGTSLQTRVRIQKTDGTAFGEEETTTGGSGKVVKGYFKFTDDPLFDDKPLDKPGSEDDVAADKFVDDTRMQKDLYINSVKGKAYKNKTFTYGDDTVTSVEVSVPEYEGVEILLGNPLSETLANFDLPTTIKAGSATEQDKKTLTITCNTILG